MGLPFDGNGTPIALSDIQTTFGGANPISMSEYYRGGAYVTDNNVDVPTNEFTITVATWLSNIARIFISESTVIPVGTSVIIAGMTPSGWNGTYTVTDSSAGTFRYAKATDPGAATVLGTATTPIGTFPIAVGNFYGASKQFSLAIAANTANLTVNSAYLTTAGWDGASYFQITVNSGIYVYSTSTASGGMNITGSFPYGFGVVNGGRIMGMGGAGGSNVAPYRGGDGGPALTITNSFTTATMSIINNSYIAGGGGGGAGMPNSGGEITGGGGGGAGGGAGGIARQNRGGYNLGVAGTGGAIGVAGTAGTGDPAGAGSGGGGSGGGGGSYVLDGISSIRDGGGCGAGGGRILPGTGGAGGTSGDNGGNGGSNNNAGGSGTFSGADHVGAGGGGGWGAAGGNAAHSKNSASGGAGGAAIDKNNSTVTVTNNAIIYGSILA
jgi:hypothetical protein